jgi:hypothetical protein
MPSMVKSEDILMLMALGGAALAIWYIAAECLTWKVIKAADLRAMMDVRDMYRKLHAATRPFVNRAMRRKQGPITRLS